MKQKVFTLLTLLVLCVTGAWAAESTAVFSLKSSSPTLKVGNITISGGSASSSGYELKSGEYKLTITADEGYFVYGAVFNFSADSNDRTGGKDAAIVASNYAYSYSSKVGTMVLGNGMLATKTATFTCKETSSSYKARIESMTVIYGNVAAIGSKIAANGYSTFCSSSILDLANLPDGLTAYKVEDANVTASSVSLTEVSVAANANTPLILKGTGGVTYNIPVAATGNAISDNKLVQGDGTTGGVAWEDGKAKYVLQGGKFMKVVNGTPATVPTTKAYLELDHDVAANELTFDFGDVTAIEKVEAKKVENGVFYNLAGQQVVQPTKGLYIVNGKKVLVP